MNHHLTTLTLLTHVSRFNSLCKLDECNSLFLTLTFIYLYLSYQSQQCKQLRLLYFQALLSQIHIKLIIHAFIYSFCSNKFITAILLLLHRGGLVMLELVLLRGEELRPIIFDGVLIDDDDWRLGTTKACDADRGKRRGKNRGHGS
jgi:hypothetical protein